jgi:hypothetical protein
LGFLLREPVQDVGVGEADGARVEDCGHGCVGGEWCKGLEAEDGMWYWSREEALV